MYLPGSRKTKTADADTYLLGSSNIRQLMQICVCWVAVILKTADAGVYLLGSSNIKQLMQICIYLIGVVSGS
jgi:hypothetical protein